jgi:acyl carrier protein
VPAPDALDRDILDMLRRISRLPVEPTLDSELLADLGFDSLLVLELVGEIEEHFAVTVPLNDLSRIRTVREVIAEVRGLVPAPDESA